MDINYLSTIPDGPLRSGLIVIISAISAIVVALIVHYVLIVTVRKLAHGRPFTTNLTAFTFNASRVCMMLFALRLVLAGAPDNTAFINQISYLSTVLLIIALTWFAMSCIESVASTVIHLNPSNVEDNLKARRVLTQTHVLTRSAHFIVGFIGLAFVLLTLPGARQFGASLLASAGVAGLVAGIAARPVLGNFIAGLQIAFSQPIRIDDVLIIEGEWGRVEEITGTFVVVKIWDERRMIVPLQWFVENPFQNWTHSSSTILGTVFLSLDFSVPIAPLRQEFERLTHASELWDKRVCVLQVTDATERTVQLRFLVSTQDSGRAFDLRCLIREGMINFITQHYPHALPRLRSSVDLSEEQQQLLQQLLQQQQTQAARSPNDPNSTAVFT